MVRQRASTTSTWRQQACAYSGIKCGLHLLHVEPLVPDSEHPVFSNGRVRFERRVKRSTAPINGKQSENRIPATSNKRGSLRYFGPGVFEARVGQPHGFETVHNDIVNNHLSKLL